jgi:uncharacterized membrane protein YecN with MAPEG domain
MAVLAVRVPLRRTEKKIVWGYGEDAELATRIRVFGNFTEYVPMLLVLMGYLELSGAVNISLHFFGVVLVLARLLHVFSLRKNNASTVQQIGRVISTFLTLLLLVTMSCYAIYFSFFNHSLPV